MNLCLESFKNLKFTSPVSQMSSKYCPSEEQTPAERANRCENCCIQSIVLVIVSAHLRAENKRRREDETNGVPSEPQIFHFDFKIFVNSQIITKHHAKSVDSKSVWPQNVHVTRDLVQLRDSEIKTKSSCN